MSAGQDDARGNGQGPTESQAEESPRQLQANNLADSTQAANRGGASYLDAQCRAAGWAEQPNGLRIRTDEPAGMQAKPRESTIMLKAFYFIAMVVTAYSMVLASLF